MTPPEGFTAYVSVVLKEAADFSRDAGVPVRVIRPENLIALYLERSARTAKRLERVAVLLDEAPVDRERLESILLRYNLELPR